MLRRTPAKRFREWELYFDAIDPIDREKRADYRAALIASMVFNMAVEPKHRKPLGDKMFLLDFEPDATDVDDVVEPVQKTNTTVATGFAGVQTAVEQERMFRMILGVPMEGAT